MFSVRFSEFGHATNTGPFRKSCPLQPRVKRIEAGDPFERALAVGNTRGIIVVR